MRTKGKRLEASHVPIGFAGNVLGLPATEHRCDALCAIDLRQHPSATGVLRDRSSRVGTSSDHVANPSIIAADRRVSRYPALGWHARQVRTGYTGNSLDRGPG